MRCRSRAGGGVGGCGWWMLVQWAALVAASGAALGHPHGRARALAAQEALLAPKQARARDSPDEPSCDQLKAMWRFSKRQARAPEIMNDIPTYRDPFTFNEWPAYPVARVPAPPRYRETYQHGYRPRPQGPTYGRVVTKAPPGAVRYASYEPDEIIGGAADDSSAANLLRFAGRVRVVNDPVPQIGRFQMLKQMIQKERAQELQRQRDADQQAARAAMLREIAAGNRGEDLDRYGYPEQEVRRLVDPDFPVADEPAPKPRHRPVSVAGRQYSRYSDSVPPPARRSPPMILRLRPMPYADYELNDPVNY